MWIELEGKRLLNFASNDYLGLASHTDVWQAIIDNVRRKGAGSGASRLISGDDPGIHLLEQELADWKGYEKCLLVGSGMLANTGLLQAVANRHTRIFSDKLNHASLVDGVRLSGADSHRYSHLDTTGLEQLLEKNPGQRRIIVTDGVFSMDGDCADIRGLLQLAEEHQTLLVIDDAHGTGTLGSDGRGLTAAVGINGDARLIEVGTFGKAFGGYGAFILGTREMIEGLQQRMRTLIYSTAMPAPWIEAMRMSLKMIKRGALVRQLQSNVRHFREQAAGLPLMQSETAIQPLLVGSDEAALKLAETLKEDGFFVPAIRPPTVPEGTSRLRITISAAHSEEQIDRLVKTIGRLLP